MARLTAAELEPRVLASVQSPDDYFWALNEGVTEASFEIPETKAAWVYLADHMRRLQRIPTADDFLAVTGCTIGEVGDLETYVKLARENELARQARAMIYRDLTELDTKPERTIQAMAQHLGQLQRSVRQSPVFYDGPDALLRLERLDELKGDSAGLTGIPTGLDSLDSTSMGFRKGEFIVVMASTSVGKSWLGCLFASAAYRAGYRVLCISPEMPWIDLNFRLDSVVSNLIGAGPISNRELMTGTVDREKYKSFLDQISVRANFVGRDSSGTGKPLTFEDVWDMANEHAPIDVVFIDGLHLLKSAGNRQRWDALMEGCATLKALAVQEQKVVIAAHQTTRAAAKDTSRLPGMYQAGYGFGVMESADRVVALAADPSGDEKRRVYKFLKQRGGARDTKARGLVFDVDIGDIREDSREMDDLPPDTEF